MVEQSVGKVSNGVKRKTGDAHSPRLDPGFHDGWIFSRKMSTLL